VASTASVSTWPTDPLAYESLFEATPSAIFALDRAGRILAANAAASELTGYSHEALLELDMAQIAPDSIKFVADALEAAGKKESSTAEMDVARQDGSLVPVQVITIPIVDGKHAGSVFFRIEEAHYLTEMRRTRAHMRTLAYYDSLTGLPNRIFFQEQLRDALEHAPGHEPCVALLFLDLDRFKDINDTLGHALGDRFLQLVGERLVLLVKNRGIVARSGGDEFVVLVSRCSGKEDVRALAEELRQSVDPPYRIEGYEQYITTSIGIALYPENGRNDQILIKNADIAMYHAKEQGRNAYFFYDEALDAPIRSLLAQEKHLRAALAHEEFILQYQPIMQIGQGNPIVGVEALVRWNHPTQGLLPPDAFIPAAEASGFIAPLGEWIGRTAAQRMRKWHDCFGFMSLAINMSARRFQQRDLCDRLVAIVREAGLELGAIEVEITESMALFDADHAIETIHALKNVGIQIAIDDFGTGHASLNYLRRIDADHLKIDRSFVAGIGSRGSDETLVKAIVAMGHSLGLKIVAEGVETSEQYEFLRLHGCDFVQGNLFAPPLDPEPLEELLTTHRENSARRK
jgi:diguanylate cyclase (GGDEF)-like protein/PAS domain S-box-containing protein